MVKAEVLAFDVVSALTRKEARTIRKCEGMIQYNMARCPNYGVFESNEYAKAQALKERIKAIHLKAKNRYDSGFA